MRSISTCSLKAVGHDRVDIVLFPGFCHSLQILQVSTIAGILARIAGHTPAIRRVFCIDFALVCHHRKCSFLSTALQLSAVHLFDALSMVFMSKRVQSYSISPDACSFFLTIVRRRRPGSFSSSVSSLISSFKAGISWMSSSSTGSLASGVFCPSSSDSEPKTSSSVGPRSGPNWVPR